MQRRTLMLAMLPLPAAAAEPLDGLQPAQRKAVQAFLRQQDANAQVDEVLLRDLDGDGQVELLLRWTAYFGNSAASSLTPFRLVNRRWQAGHSAEIRGDARGGLEVDGDGLLRLHTLTTGPNDARCCPSVKLQLRWRYAGGRLQSLNP